MARSSHLSVLRRSYQAGFSAGLLDVLRGGRYGAPPARFRKTVGSPAADRDTRYADVEGFKRDVDRSKRVAVR